MGWMTTGWTTMGWTSAQSAAMRARGDGCVVGVPGTGKTAVLAARALVAGGVLLSPLAPPEWKREMARRHPWLGERHLDGLWTIAERAVELLLERRPSPTVRAAAVQRAARELERDPGAARALLPAWTSEILMDDAHELGPWEARLVRALARGLGVPLVLAGDPLCLLDGGSSRTPGFVAVLAEPLRSTPGIRSAVDALSSVSRPLGGCGRKPRLVCRDDVARFCLAAVRKARSTTADAVAVVSEGRVAEELESMGVAVVRPRGTLGMEYGEVIAAGLSDPLCLGFAMSKATSRATAVFKSEIPGWLLPSLYLFRLPQIPAELPVEAAKIPVPPVEAAKIPVEAEEIPVEAEELPVEAAEFPVEAAKAAYQVMAASDAASGDAREWGDELGAREAFCAAMGFATPSELLSVARDLDASWDVSAAPGLWRAAARRPGDAIELRDVMLTAPRGDTVSLARSMALSGSARFRMPTTHPSPPSPGAAERPAERPSGHRVGPLLLAARGGGWQADVFVPGAVPSRADAVNFGKMETIQLSCSPADADSAAARAVHHAASLGKRDATRWRALVFKAYSGTLEEVKHAPLDDARRWKAAAAMAEACRTRVPGTVWLYDLETTGLNASSCGVLELHAEDYETGMVCCSTLVRQTAVPEKITQITGIRAEDTEGSPSEEAAMACFRGHLSACERPIVAAHNGARFDHAIASRLGAFTVDTGFADTMIQFPVLAMPPKRRGEKRSLAAAYAACLGEPFGGRSHRAAADVQMMREILDASGGAWALSATPAL